MLKKIIAVFLVLSLSAAFFSLGVWQLHRRVWKHDLVEHVNARVHAPPVDAPQPQIWAQVSEGNDAYRHVSVQGRFLAAQDAFVETTTRLGQGFWLLTPLQTDTGFIVLINRGFIPSDMRKNPDSIANPTQGEVSITGLLRMPETGGRFLRRNQPELDHWYSRDVAAIANARGLSPVAPYFIDQDAVSADTWPRGGMTVTDFPDNHLVYALTWFGLAFMPVGYIYANKFLGRVDI